MSSKFNVAIILETCDTSRVILASLLDSWMRTILAKNSSVLSSKRYVEPRLVTFFFDFNFLLRAFLSNLYFLAALSLLSEKLKTVFSDRGAGVLRCGINIGSSGKASASRIPKFEFCCSLP